MIKQIVKLTTIFIVLATCLTACFNLKEPQVKGVNNVKIIGVKDGEITMSFDVRIKNDNNIDLKVTKLDLDVTVNGTKLGKAILIDKLVIEKNQEKTYTVPINIKLDSEQGSLFTMLLGFMGNTPKVEVNGSVSAKAYGITKTVPISYSPKL